MSGTEKDLSSAHDDPEVQDYNGSDVSNSDVVANELVVDSKDMYRMGKDQQFRVCVTTTVSDCRANGCE
jgi:hypothetical protein